MAAAPFWKVYDAKGEYEAACKSPESAAALVTFLGEGATIRFDHAKRCVVWTEGVDGCAADSYDATAERCLARFDEYRKGVRMSKKTVKLGDVVGHLLGPNNPYRNIG